MNEYESTYDWTFMLLKDFREPLLSLELIYFMPLLQGYVFIWKRNGIVVVFCLQGNDENDYENANIWIHNPKWIDLKT